MYFSPRRIDLVSQNYEECLYAPQFSIKFHDIKGTYDKQ